MSWSWRIARVAGIDLYVHFTFLILLAWVGLSHDLAQESAADTAYGIGFILILFGVVVLHELGHALAARRYGIATRDITLLPIGGVARLERMPDKPSQELVVALAGPAVNILLAAGLFAVIAFVPRDPVVDDRVVATDGNLLDRLLWVNVGLAAFNLLPAFPMDGGRVLRALLAMRIDYVRATRIAARVGQGMAVLFGFAGLMGNPVLLFIALFVWLGAEAEVSSVRIRASLANLPVGEVMIPTVESLAPDDPLDAAMEHLLGGAQQDFPVVDNTGRVIGVLTRTDVLAGLSRFGPDGLVGEAMHREFVTAHPREMLDGALRRLRADGCHAIPVVAGGRVVGLLTTDHLAEWLMIREAARRPTAGSDAGRWARSQ